MAVKDISCIESTNYYEHIVIIRTVTQAYITAYVRGNYICGIQAASSDPALLDNAGGNSSHIYKQIDT